MGSILLGSIGILTVNNRVYGQTQNKTEAPEMSNMTGSNRTRRRTSVNVNTRRKNFLRVHSRS